MAVCLTYLEVTEVKHVLNSPAVCRKVFNAFVGMRSCMDVENHRLVIVFNGCFLVFLTLIVDNAIFKCE